MKSIYLGMLSFNEARELQIQAVDDTVVDYIGTGPFYPTQTDKGKPVLGAERFSVLAALLSTVFNSPKA